MIELLTTHFDLIKDIALLLLAGAFLPAAATLAVNLLRLPYVRQTVGGACYVAGRACSLTMTRWLGKHGRQLEDGVQEVVDLARDKFFEGLDQDDNGGGT